MALRPPEPLRLDRLSDAIGGKLSGSPDTTVVGLSSLEEAGPGDLAYVASDRFIQLAQTSQAAAFVVARDIPELQRPQIIVTHPALAFARLAQRFFVPPYRPRGIVEPVIRGAGVQIGDEISIWPLVTLGDRVRVGNRVTLYPGVFLGDDVVIGDDCVLHPNVTVYDGCRLGARVVIHSGTVIGSDGFGYVQHEGRHHKIAQLGTVTIEDDVEVGANVAIDRATFGETLVRRGTKIDNLVQLAHNVCIGEDCILVAQVGIAGSTTLGRHVMVGGQAGIADHLRIGDRVMIAAQSGVNRSAEGDQILSGAPIMPHEIAVKAHAVIPRLPELRQHLRDLEHRVQQLESLARAQSDRPPTRRKKRRS